MDIKRQELHQCLTDLKLRSRKNRITNVFKLKMLNSTTSSQLFKQGAQPQFQESPIKQLIVFKQQSPQLRKSPSLVSKQHLYYKKSKEELMAETKDNLHKITQTLQAVDMSSPNLEELNFLMDLQEEELEDSVDLDSKDQKELDSILPKNL
mmetsp:Transcript_9271/g.7072  ORF Transcript_9271/g.7072 Transcript_9271/m.7072 type:complete len:151 (+) Transcript_9271:2-454(+)